MTGDDNMLWKRKPKTPSYLKRLEPLDANWKPPLLGDGLTVKTAFKEFTLPPDVTDDYNRYLEPILGKRDTDWMVEAEEYIYVDRRHYFVFLVTIRLVTGEVKKYYFNKSANIKVLYSDEMQEWRNAREEYENLSWFQKLFKLFD
jgi:hypothetical protein